MKKLKPVLLIALMLCAFAAFAFDSGIEITNTVGTQTADEFGFFYDHKATLWVSIPFNNAKTSSLAIEGSIFASKPQLADEYEIIANLDLLRFTLRLASDQAKTLSMDFGRIAVSDITGLYLTTKADGLEFHGIYGFGNIDVTAAYTGLLNVRSGSVKMTSDDLAEAATEELYAFGSPRIIGKFTIQLPQVLGSMDLVTEVAGQYDLRPMLQSDYQQYVHSIFLTLSTSGPITAVPNLFYTISGTMENGILEKERTSYSILSGIATARLDLFPIAGNHIYGEVLYSPANNDIFSEFLTITPQNAGALYTVTKDTDTYESAYGNLIRISAGWNVNPIKAFNLTTAAKVFLNQEELVEVGGMYNSTELSLGATIEATSELRFNISGDLLLPKATDMKYLVSLKAILNL